MLQFYECGGCGHLHRQGFAGDCREDAERFTVTELEELHGPLGEKWDYADLEGAMRCETAVAEPDAQPVVATGHKKMPKQAKWWFAWRPVRVKGKLVWLRWIKRIDWHDTYFGY